jgi:hypothetical protein
MKIILTACLAILLTAASCKKNNNNSATDQLPPITQTGANTFGCLINGNVWLPKGYDGRFVNSRITIDPSYADGDLTIRTYRIEGDKRYSITLSSDSIKNIGLYQIKSYSRCKFVFGKNASDFSISYCSVTNSNGIGNPNNIDGYLKITKYDLVNRIFSGEFEVSFNNTDCGFGDPVRITQGRFDYRL